MAIQLPYPSQSCFLHLLGENCVRWANIRGRDSDTPATNTHTVCTAASWIALPQQLPSEFLVSEAQLPGGLHTPGLLASLGLWPRVFEEDFGPLVTKCCSDQRHPKTLAQLRIP